MNSYNDIKNFILIKLQRVQGVLENNKIHDEIINTKDIISKIGLETFAQILSVSEVSMLADNEWKTMQNELENHFNVAINHGTLIQGEEQQLRDTTWWTDREKQKTDNYYWRRYKKYIGESLPPEVVRVNDIDTDNIMNNIGNPDVEKFSRYGMVVGHVQSGKTLNYSSLICKAADVGYKFIVVVAGGINNLRNQTQERLNKAFVGNDEKNTVGVGKLGDVRRERKPISLTTTYLDFNKQDAEKNSQGLNFDNVNVPILLVIKKHTKTLDNVIEWITNQYNKQKIANHAVLLIDDESDYASINTKDEENPTTINYKIRKLLSLFDKSTYVAYTATPYANIFIDHKAEKDNIGKDLFPKDFIYALEVPSNYCGARKIFLDSDKIHLREIDDYSGSIPANHKKDFNLESIPASLYEAINIFIINIAIRCLRGQSDKHNSMLIHATRFTRVHQQIAIFVDDYIEDIRKEINVYGALNNAENYSKIIKDIEETYMCKYPSIKFTWKEVLDSVSNIIDTVVVREVHQSSTITLEYREDQVTNAIVIGGTSLARGFTLEGLSVSYFLRNTIFYDTLMQMGRWFGYRPEYEDLCKIYMTSDMIDNFTLIIEATEELFETFKRMNKEKRTPNDFGLAVRQNPDSVLQVTARNKQTNTEDYYFEMNLDGCAKETSWLDSDFNIRKNNLNTINETIMKLQLDRNSYSKIGKSYLWTCIDKKIVIEFLDKFQVYSSDFYGLKCRMPIRFIKKYVNNQDLKWDIALYSGNGEPYNINNISINKEERKVVCRDGFYEIKNRQVSSGNAEAIVLSNEELQEIKNSKLDNSKISRLDIRDKMKRPLLMLHILETKKDKKEIEFIDCELAAFGISFPASIRSGNRTEVLKINTVYIQELLERENFDD